MADEQPAQGQPSGNADGGNATVLDPAFFANVNEYLELTNRQSREHGLKRVSLASVYAAARFNSHVYLSTVASNDVAAQRTDFLDYMSTMYRRMLNEHLDGLGEERSIDVGESELAAEYAAAGVQVGGPARRTSGDDEAAPVTPSAT